MVIPSFAQGLENLYVNGMKSGNSPAYLRIIDELVEFYKTENRDRKFKHCKCNNIVSIIICNWGVFRILGIKKRKTLFLNASKTKTKLTIS